MSRGLGRVQQAVLADLKRRQLTGEHPLTTRYVPGFSRSSVSKAYSPATRQAETWPAQDLGRRQRYQRSTQAASCRADRAARSGSAGDYPPGF